MSDEPIQIIAYEIVGDYNGYGRVDNWTKPPLYDASCTHDHVCDMYARSGRPWSMLCVYDLGPLGDPYLTPELLLTEQNKQLRRKLDRYSSNSDFGMF